MDETGDQLTNLLLTPCHRTHIPILKEITTKNAALVHSQGKKGLIEEVDVLIRIGSDGTSV